MAQNKQKLSGSDAQGSTAAAVATTTTTTSTAAGPTRVQPQSFEQLNASSHAHAHSHLSAQPMYRASTLFRSRPDISESQFYTHWYSIHGPLVAPWALAYNMLEYTQYHTPRVLRERLSDGREGGFRKASPFEACADMYIRDYADYMAAFHDPYYVEVISKDEDLFVDKGQVEWEKGREEAGEEGGDVADFPAISTLGVCRSVIRDGKIMVDVPDSVWRVWEEYQERKKVKDAEQKV